MKKLKLNSNKLLKKPTVDIQKKDILKALKNSQGYKMTREEKLETTDYNRSVYFNDEFKKETKEKSKWLS